MKTVPQQFAAERANDPNRRADPAVFRAIKDSPVDGAPFTCDMNTPTVLKSTLSCGSTALLDSPAR